MKRQIQRWGLGVLLSLGASACQVASPPIPSFSRDHNKKPRDGAEHLQDLLAIVERCLEASRQDLSHPQHQARAKLLCRQSGQALQASPTLDSSATLFRKVQALQTLYASGSPQAEPIAAAIQELAHAADELHQVNDPTLIAQLGQHAAKWHITGMKLRLALRSWRRCQEKDAAAGQRCAAKRKATQEALQAFGRALDSLLAEQPFGTRSFRRCAQRSLLPHPPHAKGIAQLAPDHPSRLRNCERMAARIPWNPI